MELQIKFQISDVSIYNGNKKYPIGTSTFYPDFCVQALLSFHCCCWQYKLKLLFVIPYLLFLPQTGKFGTKSDDSNFTNFNIFDKNLSIHWYILSAILKKRFLHAKQIMTPRVFVIRLETFIIPQISVDSNISFTSYAWLCALISFHRLLC